MRLTKRAAAVALPAALVAALAWPEGTERVVRGALVLLGAAFVADLVTGLQQALPTESLSPFAPVRTRPQTPSLPKGLVDLQRDIQLLTIDAGARRLPLSTRLRSTARGAAQERLQRHGLALREADAGEGEPDDHEAAARQLLGDDVYDYLAGHAPTVDAAALLAAVDAP